ncbi:MAG: carboxypeptidase regulatory-like domain-containing protein, partial [Polaromonas sp.]|nr:carboxypeptidase regulatory-like domain-containing protein [Gemmatimonadaceae bacterium]
MPRLPSLIALLFVVAPMGRTLTAQQASGRIVGRVIDATSGAGITDAGVQVVGTSVGTGTGVDGRFTLPSVTAGTVALRVRRIGYASKTITGLLLDAGHTLEQD